MNNKDKLNEELIKLLCEQQKLEEMSAIRKKDYNLPVNIWIDDKGSERTNKHNLPRLKIQTTYEDKLDEKHLLSLSIDKKPKVLAGEMNELKNKDFKIIKNFVIKNYDLLIQYWKQEIGLRELLNKLQEL